MTGSRQTDRSRVIYGAGLTVAPAAPSHDPAADAALLGRLLAGEARAAHDVWTRHLSMVRRVIARGLGPSHQSDVDDVVQDVFLSVFRGAKDVRDPSAFRSFVFSAAVNGLRMALRARKRRAWLRVLPWYEVPEAQAHPVDDEAVESVRRLYAVLDRLDETSRTAFVLRHVEGFELTEIAVALRVPMTTLKRRLKKAVTRVTKAVADDATMARFVGRGTGGTVRGK